MKITYYELQMINFLCPKCICLSFARNLWLQILQLGVKNRGLRAPFVPGASGGAGRGVQGRKLLREPETFAQTLRVEKAGFTRRATDPPKFPRRGGYMRPRDSMTRRISSSCQATAVNSKMLPKMRPEPTLMKPNCFRIIVGLISSLASSRCVQGQWVIFK